jgi:hypothetical protein
MAGVGLNDGMQQAMECVSKLHGLWLRLFEHSAIGTASGELIDKPLAAAGLGDFTDWAEPQVGELLGSAPDGCAQRRLVWRVHHGCSWRLVGQSGGSHTEGGGLQILSRGVRCKEHLCTPGTERVM